MSSHVPNSKITDGLIGGQVAAVTIWALAEYAGVTMPTEIAAAVTVLIAAAVGYLLPERRATSPRG